MRAQLYRWLIGATVVGAVGTASAQPVERDHRGGGGVTVQGGVTVDVPREAPPPVREEPERARGRAGFQWQSGRWDWSHGKWEWRAGHWERERHGKRWREARWENRGGTFVLVDGGWDDAPANPNAAPPALREEKWEPRNGFVYVRGRWDWRNGEWGWTAGHYEREREHKRWREARWENKGGSWVMVEGGWDDAPLAPVAAPPPLREEKFEGRHGFVFVKGRWDWHNGDWQWQPGHWEKERHGKHWRDATWENRNGQWVKVDGDWIDEAPIAQAAPPPIREERFENRAGFVWVRGRWDWKNGNYEWINGHYERERANQIWNEGRWENRGGSWFWVEGSWGGRAVAPPPPPPTTQGGVHVGVSIGGGAPPPPPPSNSQPAPPAPQAENFGAKAGFVWARGHWGWSQSSYQWIPGHWERERANKQWIEGHWDQNGGTWTYTEGTWR